MCSALATTKPERSQCQLRKKFTYYSSSIFVDNFLTAEITTLKRQISTDNDRDTFIDVTEESLLLLKQLFAHRDQLLIP